ncbi:MAG: hypothetical protein IPK82_19470 [Polyangiaceae bacterium]|nr:hypothetical protein [Polyangiaceae bacterium]
MTRIEILHEQKMLRIASHGNVIINVWNDAPDVSQMQAYMRVAQHFCATRPRVTALLNGVIRGTPSFSEGVRDEVVKSMRMRGTFKLGVAHLITVGGLAGSATRAFLSTAILLGRPKTPSKVFSNPRESCEWLASRLHGTPSELAANDLFAAFEQACLGR